jgi:hypothetical protein
VKITQRLIDKSGSMASIAIYLKRGAESYLQSLCESADGMADFPLALSGAEFK